MIKEIEICVRCGHPEWEHNVMGCAHTTPTFYNDNPKSESYHPDAMRDDSKGFVLPCNKDCKSFVAKKPEDNSCQEDLGVNPKLTNVLGGSSNNVKHKSKTLQDIPDNHDKAIPKSRYIPNDNSQREQIQTKTNLKTSSPSSVKRMGETNKTAPCDANNHAPSDTKSFEDVTTGNLQPTLHVGEENKTEGEFCWVDEINKIWSDSNISYQDKFKRIKEIDAEFLKRREARLRNQIRIHWKWLKNKSEKEIADFIVSVANAETGEKLK